MTDEKPLLDRVRDARARAAVLHTQSDTLNVHLMRAQVALADLNLGATAEVPLANGETLSFRKHDNAWQLVIDSPDRDTKPLVRASRQTRLLAVQVFEGLVEALIDNAVDELARVEESIEVVRAFVDEIVRVVHQLGTEDPK